MVRLLIMFGTIIVVHNTKQFYNNLPIILHTIIIIS